MSTASITEPSSETSAATDRLTAALEQKLSHPATSPDFDLHAATSEVLRDIGLTAADAGGKLTFYGRDPILPSPIRFASLAAVGLAARSVAVAALWRQATGQGQDISVDVRKALRRFAGFFEGKWETINGRPPSPGGYAVSPFLKMGDAFFRETRDGRYVLALDIYPQLLVRTVDFLGCSPSTKSINDAILKWNAVELEEAAAAEGLVLAMVRTNEEFRREPQYTDVLSKMPLITVEKIGESEPVPLKASDNLPLAGVRALGMGHVIAGAGMGRDMALYGADVLNIWRPRDSEIEAFAWDVQVGMRSTILDDAKEDREKFNQLLKDADVFFANKRPGFLKKHGLFTIEGSPTRPKQPPIVPIADNVVGWLGTTGILAALRRRAIEGGSYRVVVSLTRTVLWLLSLGIFDKAYAKATADSTDEHKYIAPDLFTAETPLGTYQGMTDQIVLSRTPGAYRTVLVPRGSSKPEWLPNEK